MKKLAQKIASLSKTDYDKTIYTLDEIKEKMNPDTAKRLELCHKHGIKADITVSEIIHSRSEIARLKKEDVGFRSEGINDAEIIALEELVTELDAILLVDFTTAQRYQQMAEQQASFDEAVKEVQPLCEQLSEIEKALKAKVSKVNEIQSSQLVNPLDADMFRLALAMSSPAGLRL